MSQSKAEMIASLVSRSRGADGINLLLSCIHKHGDLRARDLSSVQTPANYYVGIGINEKVCVFLSPSG